MPSCRGLVSGFLAYYRAMLVAEPVLVKNLVLFVFFYSSSVYPGALGLRPATVFTGPPAKFPPFPIPVSLSCIFFGIYGCCFVGIIFFVEVSFSPMSNSSEVIRFFYSLCAPAAFACVSLILPLGSMCDFWGASDTALRNASI